MGPIEDNHRLIESTVPAADDEPHIRDLLRKYLEMERYMVDLAADCQEAWRKLANMDYKSFGEIIIKMVYIHMNY